MQERVILDISTKDEEQQVTKIHVHLLNIRQKLKSTGEVPVGNWFSRPVKFFNSSRNQSTKKSAGA